MKNQKVKGKMFMLFFAIGASLALGPNFTIVEAPVLEVNLDLPAHQRFAKVSDQHCNTLRRFKPVLTAHLKRILGDKWYPKFKAKLIQNSLESNGEYYEEVNGLSARCNVSSDFLFMMNYIYEFETVGCTSIAFQAIAGMTLATNLDYNFPDFYGDLTVKAVYRRYGKVVMEANQMIGFIGFSRGYKKMRNGNTMLFSLNARGVKRRADLNREVVYNHLVKSRPLPVIYQLREVFMAEQGLEMMSKFMKEIEILAPCYLILTDSIMAKIIERNPIGYDEIYTAGVNFENWYLVQTNIDASAKRIKDPRREVPINYLKGQKRGLETGEDIFKNILTKSPNWYEFTSHKSKKAQIIRTISSTYVTLGSEFKVVIYKKIQKSENPFKKPKIK